MGTTTFYFQKSTGQWLHRVDYNIASSDDERRASCSKGFGIPEGDVGIVANDQITEVQRERLTRASLWAGPPPNPPRLGTGAVAIKEPLPIPLTAEGVRIKRLRELRAIGRTAWTDENRLEILDLLLAES